MAITQITNQSLGSRLMSSIKGVAIGAVLFVIAFPVLYVNEQFAVKSYKQNADATKNAVAVSPDKLDPANEGKFVHFNGRATTTETLKDQDFAVSANAIKLVRTVVSALLDEGGAEIRVANRTFEHAETLRAHLGDRVTPVKWAHATDAAEGVATVVNTTSLGMMGQPPLPFQLDAAPPDALVADLVYQPLETPLLAAARARGLTAVDGLGMLLHQAGPGFEAWFGRRPEVDDDLRAAVLAE
jgi:hypothetical protein